MNNRLLEGEKLIQCFIDSKTRMITGSPLHTALLSGITTGFLLLARYNLGLSAAPPGPGLYFTRGSPEIGWSTATLTEDLEYSMQALLKVTAPLSPWKPGFTMKTASLSPLLPPAPALARGQINVAICYAPGLLGKGLLGCNPPRLRAACA